MINSLHVIAVLVGGKMITDVKSHKKMHSLKPVTSGRDPCVFYKQIKDNGSQRMMLFMSLPDTELT